MGYFKRYKKYAQIQDSERERLLKLVKSGFDPEQIEVASPTDDPENIEEAEEKREKLRHQLEMIQHYFKQIELNALKQQRLAIFDQKREQDIVDARLKILDEVDIKKPDLEINKFTIYDVDQSGKVVGERKTPIVKEVEE